MELFKLVGTIALQGKDGFNRDLDDASNKAGKFASKLKNGLGTAAKIGAKAVTASLAVAGAAIGAITKSAIENYAEYEQLVGGVETLFGAGGKSIEDYAESVGKSVDEVSAEYYKLMKSQQTVLANAENAYKNAGLSANEYMETVTSFSASLLQSLDGDTQAAAEKADMAITDMADNANKMGTDMASIQNAYQGFAKQNYTMLDNLKLGYGGTKEEMARLLKDAEKISGIKYDISSYADIVDAIHVVQTEMDITGTTAAEASSTIQGSISSAKASWQNWLTALGDSNANMEEKTNELIESIGVAVHNILPVFKQVLTSLGQTLGDKLPELLSQAAAFVVSNLPQILDLGWQLIKALLQGIWQGIDEIFGISDYFSQAWEDIKDAFSSVGDFFGGIWESIKGAFSSVTDWFSNVFTEAWNAVKNVFSSAGQIFEGVTEGIADVFVKVVNAIIKGINKVIAVPFNKINGILNWIRSIEIVGYEPFADLWGKDPLAVPQIPLLATGGVLKKGQIGLLEGSGAEAVVPLEKNTGWINGIAERLNALQGNAPVNSNAVLAKLDAILDAILNMGNFREAIDGAAFKINDREFARLVKGVG